MPPPAAAPSLYHLLTEPLSTERLDAYRQPRDTDTLDPIARYLWNMALCEALYPTLQALEVALRNILHAEISRIYGPTWYDNLAVVVLPQGRRSVAEVKAALTQEKKPHDPGRVVAGLTFGFWTSLCNVAYERHLWQRLWRSPTLFPRLPRKHRTRAHVSARMNRVRRLRNRVFHHEPVWHWKDLGRQHADVLEALEWISPVLREVITPLDRFPATLAATHLPYRSALAALCRRRGYAR